MANIGDPLEIAADFRSELSKERLQKAEIAQRLKETERTHTHQVNQMKSLLEAEQDRTLKLNHLLSDRHSASQASLEAQLQEALDHNHRLTQEITQLRRYSVYEGIEKEFQEQQSKNYSLAERVKELELQVESGRQNTVKPKQLTEIREKETKIVELEAQVEDLQDHINELEEIDTLTEPEPILQRTSVKDIRQKTDVLETHIDKMTLEKWQLTEEIQDLKTHYERELQGVIEHSKAETEALKSKVAQLKGELREATDELTEEVKKAAIERERRRELQDEMHVKEDVIEKLRGELDSLGRRLLFREQKIEKLENEISQEADEEYDYSGRIKELTRLNSQLTSHQREVEAEIRKTETERGRVEGALAVTQREVKKLQHERKELTEQVKRLEEEVEGMKEQFKLKDERIVAIKEDLQKEMTSRILELRREKLQLEERIEELLECELPRKSLDLSMQDELASLDDFRLNRLSIKSSRSSRLYIDLKSSENLKVELGEKDYLIKSLRADKETLEKKLEELHKQVYQFKSVEANLKSDLAEKESRLTGQIKAMKTKHKFLTEELENEIVELRSDIEKFQRQTLRSAELLAEENNKMMADLSLAEHAAITAKLQYAQAATDLEILMKKFNDGKAKKKRFGFFRRDKIC
jgi:chromosome segregation ATPase